VWYEGSGTSDRRFYLRDMQGSIISVSNSAGTAIKTYTYDEYGVPGGDTEGRFRYTGQTWLPQVGLYHYKARVYSPTLGRFLQTDPIGYDDGLNWYAYVRNDPLNKVDPTGTAWFRNFTCSSSSGEGNEVIATCSNNWVEVPDAPARTPNSPSTPTVQQRADLACRNATRRADESKKNIPKYLREARGSDRAKVEWDLSDARVAAETERAITAHFTIVGVLSGGAEAFAVGTEALGLTDVAAVLASHPRTKAALAAAGAVAWGWLKWGSDDRANALQDRLDQMDACGVQ